MYTVLVNQQPVFNGFVYLEHLLYKSLWINCYYKHDSVTTGMLLTLHLRLGLRESFRKLLFEEQGLEPLLVVINPNQESGSGRKTKKKEKERIISLHRRVVLKKVWLSHTDSWAFIPNELLQTLCTHVESWCRNPLWWEGGRKWWWAAGWFQSVGLRIDDKEGENNSAFQGRRWD